ncbi:MAG: bifunctional (p)ppGpp synthetase/guanosine-3',5'-bis(diphosphate) 3'-pyrophosphohydrolase [Bacteroidota bacterium]|jgi:RelA/SpoT family (p)ppGpp synthetase|nr:bifunctional (p)ppGpp synthetase/guanosine-3',5'-bis(diphosphate) 3'-pyrophosphohydrolase [Bacteroidota bacterium]
MLGGLRRSTRPTAGGAPRQKLEALLAVCRSNLHAVDEELIARAFGFMLQAHRDHRRKSGEPYSTHPYAVAMIVAQEIPLDDVSVVAALLHDVIEDCEEYEYKDIKEEFGGTVADIVEGATKISTLLVSKEITKAENYRKLMVSMINDIRVILVKFADRLHNMRTLEFVGDQKQQRIARETLEIYAPLAHRFGLGRIKWELEDLSFKYLYPEEYRKLKSQVAVKRRDREDYIERFCAPLRRELGKAGIAFEMIGRPKHLYSIFKKMQDRNKTFDEIYDLFAIRIVLDTKEEKDCYLAYAITCEVYTPIPERYKNYIALPKQNGYKSIHTTVLGPDGKMVEVQIRTREMHEIAEKGIAAHWAYKESIPNKATAFENWIRWVREILESPQPPTSDEEGARQLLDNFQRNLYQEEIVVFTPKGDLIVLPNGSTPVDFAFEIHSEVGLHTIGAKVNGRIVPLGRKLHSGDQVEVITSRNQHISPDWELQVVTHKAKAAIRRFVNEQTKQVLQDGRDKWERRARKLKIALDDEPLIKAAQVLRFPSLSLMLVALAKDEIRVDDIVKAATAPPEVQHPTPELPQRDAQQLFEEFAERARGEKGMVIQGEATDIQYEFARCCSPLPGDEVIGFVTLGHGIKIHRRSCRNIQRLQFDTSDGSMRDRLVEIDWPSNDSAEYLGGIRVEGEDRPGILNEIALAVTSYRNTNIRSVNIETENTIFRGSVLVTVTSLEHLERLIERLKKVKGISTAERYVEMT